MTLFTKRWAAAAAGTVALGTAGVVMIQEEVPHYQPREGVFVEQGIHGALAYLHSLRANQVTGEVDPAWILAAQEQADRLAAGKTASLEWESVGPDNGGGRTRALLGGILQALTSFSSGEAGKGLRPATLHNPSSAYTTCQLIYH